MIIKTQKNKYKWFLIRINLDEKIKSNYLHLREKKRPHEFEITLPITPSRLVHEIVCLPYDVKELTVYSETGNELLSSDINLKLINKFERFWRMSYRILNTYKNLTKKQRNRIGLTTWKCILNITESYQIASKLRWRMSESEWLTLNHQSYINNKFEILSHIEKFTLTPRFYILINQSKQDDMYLIDTLNSLKEQLYKNFTCIILSDNSSKTNLSKLDVLIEKIGYQSFAIAKNALTPWLNEFNESINENNHWLMFMTSGESLPPHSLYCFASEINSNEEYNLIYSDDAIQSTPFTFESPRFKPDFSIEHIRSTNYIGVELHSELTHLEV